MVDFTHTRRIFTLAVAVVLVASVVSVGVIAQPTTTEQEPNDDRQNATPLTIGLGRNDEFAGGEVSGSVNNTIDEETYTIIDPDVDWFKFNATAGQAINFYTGSFATLPSYVTLYGPDGEVIAESSMGSADIFTAGAVADETGTYYFRVNSSNSYDGSVGYSFTFQIANPDSFEPNDDIGGATPVESGNHVNGTIIENETDFFAVEADTGENISARIDLRDLPTDNPNNIAVDILNANGERISETFGPKYDWSNATELTGEDETMAEIASANATVEEAGTYYIRVKGASTGFGEGGFASYKLAVDVNSSRSAPTDALVIIGGTPENKVTYEFTYEGSVTRSGKSHGAPIEDRHVTIDRDIDKISDSRVSGRLGGGGDAYLITGEITGFELDGEASIYLNGEEIDPAMFGGIPEKETSTPTPSPTPTTTPTPTPTSTATPTATPTMTPKPTTTTAQTPTPTVVTTETEAATSVSTPTETEDDGRILGGTATETKTPAGGPGFGLAVALVSLLVTGLLAVRRR